MSASENVEITCPRCGKTGSFTVWHSINTDTDPEMRDAVRDGSAFIFECRKCGHRIPVNYGFLYHQPDERMMLHYCPNDESVNECLTIYGKNGKMAEMQLDGYLTRIVRSINELREKLFIFDACLDDRVIEVMKLLYISEFDSTSPEAAVDRALCGIVENRLMIELVSKNRSVGTFEADMSLYDQIAELVDERCAVLREEEPIVDLNWACAHATMILG